mmetsp:Transcript_24568/g.77702  ORF Transcript_24568/g.77702 Transcript_24568/m.77702 type:complete len:287 (-) Transcript_24568:23-883(-)
MALVSRSSFMEREILVPLMPMQRTSTSWSTATRVAGSTSTKSEVISDTWTRPSTPSCTVTNAPNLATLVTLPLIMSPTLKVYSILGCSLRGFFSRLGDCSDFMEREILSVSLSTESTRTSTSWPAATTSLGSDTNSSLSWEMWTRPSVLAPMSTKAPYACTDFTVPLKVLPSVTSSICTVMLRLGPLPPLPPRPPPRPPLALPLPSPAVGSGVASAATSATAIRRMVRRDAPIATLRVASERVAERDPRMLATFTDEARAAADEATTGEGMPAVFMAEMVAMVARW